MERNESMDKSEHVLSGTCVSYLSVYSFHQGSLKLLFLRSKATVHCILSRTKYCRICSICRGIYTVM